MLKLLFYVIISLYFVLPVELIAKEKLYIYSWSDSLPESLIEQFSKEYNIKVELSSYENNETMFAKLKLLSGYESYDIVFPSSYYIKKLLDNNLLHKLDKNKIQNSKFLSPEFLGLSFDSFNEYSLPFAVYFTGILYNKNHIKDPSKSWNELFLSIHKKKLLLLDDMREVFHIALSTLGYCANSVSTKEITEAYHKLRQLMPNVRLLSSESIQSSFATEEVSIGMCWNAEAGNLMRRDSRFAFFLPQEGPITSIDNFVVLKNAKNTENAYKFINFIMRPEVSKQIMERFLITIPNSAARKMLSENITKNNTLFPRDVQDAKIIVQEDLQGMNNKYIELWERLKIY
jgi:spermidine/putrescine transport system substrate-binding protein